MVVPAGVGTAQEVGFGGGGARPDCSVLEYWRAGLKNGVVKLDAQIFGSGNSVVYPLRERDIPGEGGVACRADLRFSC